MLKNILNLDGAQQLSKNEQKEINGGIKPNTGCLPGGFRSNIGMCACSTGIWIESTQSCKDNLYTGNIYETETTCCYSQMGGEF